MNKALFELLHNSTNPNFNDMSSNIKFLFIFYTIVLAVIGFLIYSIIYEHIQKSRHKVVKTSIIIIIMAASLSGITTYVGPIKSAIETKNQWESTIKKANKSSTNATYDELISMIVFKEQLTPDIIYVKQDIIESYLKEYVDSASYTHVREEYGGNVKPENTDDTLLSKTMLSINIH